MADGLLGSVLGDEEDKESVEAELEAAVSADAFAAAVAARLSANDPEVARKTAEFLTDQSELLRVQKKHLIEEHELRLTQFRNQKREGGIRRFGMRIRVVFQLFFAVAAGVVGVGVLVMVHDAVRSRSVVIEPFDISPNAATQVPSGKIVAAGLLDVLTRIQAATRSNAEHRNLSNAWTNDIAIEVPETGISIGQIERILTARLGHDQHIQGDLVATEKGGLALTVRGSGVLPKTFTDEARNLDRLLTQAGEYVYSQSQPGLWGAYLTQNDRDDEAIRFCQAVYATADPGERPYLLNAWGTALGDKGGDGTLRAALPRPQSLEPPSTRMTSPVIQPASSEARNATTGAMSSGWARRFSACKPSATSRPASVLVKLDMSVSTTPGATALTRMPRAPSSAAKCFTSVSIAPLVAA
jgi:hypothetical protein